MHRIWLGKIFSERLTDSDQIITWLAAKDISQGSFHTPFYYGQLYNNMLSAWIAAPFIFFGMKVYTAVPWAANFIGFAPFLFPLLYFFRTKNLWGVTATALIYFLLPIEYHMIAAMARGFSGGIFILTLGYYLFKQTKNYFKFTGLFLMLISFVFNPNVLLIIFPLLMLEWPELKGLLRKRIGFIITVLSVVCVLSFLEMYRINHQKEVVHKLWEMDFSFQRLFSGLHQTQEIYAWNLPLAFNGLICIIIALSIAIALFILNKKAGILWSFLMVLMILSLGLNKVYDARFNIFYPYTRMYLAVPVFLILVVGTIRKDIVFKWIIPSLLICISGFAFHVFKKEEVILHAKSTNPGLVQVTNIKRLILECREIAGIAKEKNADVLVFVSKSDKYNYGCAVLENMNTIHPGYERRFWQFTKTMDKVYPNILWLDWGQHLEENLQLKTGTFTRLEVPYPAWLQTSNSETIRTMYHNNGLVLPENFD